MGKKMMFWFFCVLLVSCAVSGQGQDPDAFAPEEAGGGRRREIVPAFFIFGDSLIDNGNNNNLQSFAKANYFPYGIDFEGGPTGRFSNGYTMVDEIAELLGLPLIPAYSEASGDQALHGVNYASAAAGILDITGRNFVGRIPFNQQIKNFENTLDQITGNLGAADLAQALGRSIFFVGMGSNDYLNNYLMPNYPTRNEYDGQQYADLLIREYSQQLTADGPDLSVNDAAKNLKFAPFETGSIECYTPRSKRRVYNLGGRKFVLAGLGLMGCIPSILSQSVTGRCSEEVNQLMIPFNANIKTMMNNLSTNLPGSHFTYINIHNMIEDILTNYRSYGFSVINRGCCGIGRNRGQITCLPFQTPCPNREQYVFWDAFHPTEAVNIIMGRKAFSGDQTVVSPINIQQLANL